MGSLASQPSLISEPYFSVRKSVPQIKVDGSWRTTSVVDLWPPHPCACIPAPHMCICIHTETIHGGTHLWSQHLKGWNRRIVRSSRPAWAILWGSPSKEGDGRANYNPEWPSQWSAQAEKSRKHKICKFKKENDIKIPHTSISSLI